MCASQRIFFDFLEFFYILAGTAGRSDPQNRGTRGKFWCLRGKTGARQTLLRTKNRGADLNPGSTPLL